MARIRAKFHNTDPRILSIGAFGLFYAWAMAVPFQGHILDELAKIHQIEVQTAMYFALGVHVLGLFASGFVKKLRWARWLMFHSAFTCLIASIILLLPVPNLFSAALVASMFMAGFCAGSWGFYYKYICAPRERKKTAVQVLVLTNALVLALNVIAVHLSPYVALGVCIGLLLVSMRLILLLPTKQKDHQEENNVEQKFEKHPEWMLKTFIFLWLFVAASSIEGGFMFQAINPAYAHLSQITCCYWTVPYIAAILIVNRLPERMFRYMLYVAIAIGGFGLMAFWYLPNNVLGYVIVNTFLMGAAGIVHLFLWSTLGSMLSYSRRPAHIFGMGIASNSLGIFIGGMYGRMIADSPHYLQQIAAVALLVIFVSLILLTLMQMNIYRMYRQIGVYGTSVNIQNVYGSNDSYAEYLIDLLTAREHEVMTLLLRGFTYKAIASELSISENTVKTYVKNVYAKLEVRSRTELIQQVNSMNTGA